MNRCIALISFLMMAGLMGGSALAAQESQSAAPVTLTVKDESGARVAGAQVEVYSLPARAARSWLTDPDGVRSFELAPGSYELVVSMQGFRTEKRQLEIQNDAPQKIEVVLKVGTHGGVMVTSIFPVEFPAQARSLSPDGRFALVGGDGDAGLSHPVFLEDTRTHIRRKLFEYRHRVSLLWNYSSTAIAVTDHDGGESARCRICFVDATQPAIECLDPLLRQLYEDARNILKSRMTNHHFYVEATVWSAAGDLTLKIRGDGDHDPSGFLEYYDLLANSIAVQAHTTKMP